MRAIQAREDGNRSRTTSSREKLLEDIMDNEPTTRPVTDLSLLNRGDDIEARRGSICYRGRVKEVAAGLGMVWIREHGHGGRRALPADDYTIHRAG
jgi:hypothetical protein